MFHGQNCDPDYIYNRSTIVAGTTDSEGEMVPCSQDEERGSGAAAWMADIEEETFASTVSDREPFINDICKRGQGGFQK